MLVACTISLIVTGHNSLVPTIQRFGRYGSECKRVCWSGGGTCTAEGKEGTGGGGANIDPGKKEENKFTQRMINIMFFVLQITRLVFNRLGVAGAVLQTAL